MPLRPFIGDEPTLPTRRPGEPLAGENVVQTRTPPVPLDKTAGASEWGTFRPNQGPSGTWHWGLDIPARPTTAVVAPESMTVVEVWTGDVAPFVGYGPAGVLAKGIAASTICSRTLTRSRGLTTTARRRASGSTSESKSVSHLRRCLLRMCTGKCVSSQSTRRQRAAETRSTLAHGATALRLRRLEHRRGSRGGLCCSASGL